MAAFYAGRNEQVPEKSRSYPVIAGEHSAPRAKSILYIRISAASCYVLSQTIAKHEPNISKYTVLQKCLPTHAISSIDLLFTW